MGVKISDLPASAGAGLAMQFEVNNAGASQRLTLAQMFALSTGAVIADTPLLNFAQTWNNAAVAFTALKLDVTDSASDNASLLIDFKVGGASKLKLDKAGWLYASVLSGVAGAFSAVHFGSTTSLATIDQNGVTIRDTYCFAWASGANAAVGTKDLFLCRDAAGTLAVRDGANAQTFRLYNTFTDASNYERGGMTWNTNRLFISTENAGSGAARSIRVVAAGDLELGSGNADRWRLSSAGHLLAQADNTYDIGALAANRPKDINLVGALRWSSGYQLYQEPGSGRIKLQGYAGLDLTTYNGTAYVPALSVTGNGGADTLNVSLFGLLQFGGTTNAFPALKRSADALHVRLADDSGYAAIRGKLTTEAAAVSETITPDKTLTLYDVNGTAYKVPCVAA